MKRIAACSSLPERRRTIGGESVELFEKAVALKPSNADYHYRPRE